MLYEKCPFCLAGTAEPEKRLSNGHCPGCDDKLYVPIGLTARQLGNISGALRALIGKSIRESDTKCDGENLRLRIEQAFSASAGGAAIDTARKGKENTDV
jgi:hypothetical protein